MQVSLHRKFRFVPHRVMLVPARGASMGVYLIFSLLGTKDESTLSPSRQPASLWTSFKHVWGLCRFHILLLFLRRSDLYGPLLNKLRRVKNNWSS